MNIDMHTHVIPLEFIELVKRDPVKYQARIIVDATGQQVIEHDQGYKYPLFKGFYDMPARLAEMKERNIDIDVISVSPTLFYYWADKTLATEIAQICNDSIASIIQRYPKNFRPVGTVPLQDINASIIELERIVKFYNFKIVTIGTSLEGRNLDEPEFIPFFEKAAELGVATIFHPYYVGNRAGLESYYLTNLIGNPLDTTICISRLVLSGLIEKIPSLKLIFVHGGGYIPYQRGRLQHGYKVREETKARTSAPVSGFDSLYYDTITHWGTALQYLIESHGSEKVVLGSDYPFDMADPDPVKTVEKLELGSIQKANVLGRNAALMLDLIE